MRRAVILVVLASCRGPASHADAPPTIAEVARPEPVVVAGSSSVPAPLGPVDTPAARAGHAAAQARLLPREPPLPALGDVSDTDGDDVPPAFFIPVLDPPDGAALAGWHAALRELDRGARARVRIAMYGASGTAADVKTAYVRTYLQTRFGTGGPGFVPFVPLSRWYRHNEVDVRASDGWRVLHAVRDGGDDGRLGWLGAGFEVGRRGAWAEVAGKRESPAAAVVTRIEVHALARPGGGRLRVRIDGREVDTIATAAEEHALLVREYDVPAGRHAVRIETLDRAPVRVFGAVFEGERGVVVDTLGIDGARARNHLRWDASIWNAALHRRAPDVITLAYGTNEAVDEDEPIERLRADMAAVIERLRREHPDAACVLLGPGDFPKLGPDGPRPRPRLVEIVALERELAAQHGCGFWDGLAFMGGDGSMARWVEATPPLARADHLHFVRRGACTSGQALSDALVQGYDAPASR